MRRKDREVTDSKQVEAILNKAKVCRIALCDGEVPYIVPVSFGYRDGCLYFHSAPQGRKLELMRKNNRVCFEVETDVTPLPGETPCRWSMSYASAVGFGRVYILEDPKEKREGIEIVFQHYSDSQFDVPEHALQNVIVLKLQIDSMTAKASGHPSVLEPGDPSLPLESNRATRLKKDGTPQPDIDRLERQIRFILEIDKLKTISRQTLLIDGSRQENSAEHSWHLALMALVLSEHTGDAGIDWLRVLKMLLVHDLVEIDAGDTFCYDVEGNNDKQEREEKAAERIFNILPADQASDFRVLWEEFEARKTSEARFAAAIDRLQPILHNYSTSGRVWRKHGVNSRLVLSRNRIIQDGSPTLWQKVSELIDEAVKKGFLPE